MRCPICIELSFQNQSEMYAPNTSNETCPTPSISFDYPGWSHDMSKLAYFLHCDGILHVTQPDCTRLKTAPKPPAIDCCRVMAPKPWWDRPGFWQHYKLGTVGLVFMVGEPIGWKSWCCLCSFTRLYFRWREPRICRTPKDSLPLSELLAAHRYKGPHLTMGSMCWASLKQILFLAPTSGRHFLACRRSKITKTKSINIE